MEIIKRVWPGTLATEVTTEVLGCIEGGTKGREVFQASFLHRERSDTGGPVIPDNI